MLPSPSAMSLCSTLPLQMLLSSNASLWAAGIVGRRTLVTATKANIRRPSASAATPAMMPSSTLVAATSLPSNKTFLRSLHTSDRRDMTRLAEVGKLEPPRVEDYDTGQMFLHRLFGYRGVILFARPVTVANRDEFNESSKDKKMSSENMQKPPSPPGTSGPEMEGNRHTYYMVLIDNRDWPFSTPRSLTESVTYLSSHNDITRLYSVPGLDYVAHEDILPYVTEDRSPIQHELFHQFLRYKDTGGPPLASDQAEGSGGTGGGGSGVPSSFCAQDALVTWQRNRQSWMELNTVHRETTNGIRVTAIAYYMGFRENQQGKKYWWRYCILLENLGEDSVQLRERHWKIFAVDGSLETVRGRGVVGQEPHLSKQSPAFQYSAHVSLTAPSGHMWGHLKMERRDGQTFEVKIPAFVLESKTADEGEDDDGSGGGGASDPPSRPHGPDDV